MKKIYMLLALMAYLAVGCQTESDLKKEGDTTEQFDPLFATALQKRGYIPDAKNIKEDDVAKIQDLDVSTQNKDGMLTSLKGIEFFDSLQTLSCEGNQLSFQT